MTIFDYNSTIQAKWSEPRLESIKENLLKVYKNPNLLESKKIKAKSLAKTFDWNIIINIIINRLKQIAKSVHKI